MKKTRTQKNRGLQKQSESLWLQVETHYHQTQTYTQKAEWISAYYNLLLASLCCKHYVESLQITIPDDAHHQTSGTNHQKCLQKDKPLESVLYLYALIPKYKQKIEAFQEAFGCPKTLSSSKRSSSKRSSSKRSEVSSPSHHNDNDTEDCDAIQSIDLSKEEVIRFVDVMGNDVAKQTISDGLLYPLFMPLLYPTQTRAILFYGPPGTGKTLLAKATAHELNQYDTSLRVLFYAPTADQFKGKYVGETEEKIVRLFKCASQHAREEESMLNQQQHSVSANATKSHHHIQKQHIRVQSVIFIDELDSLARRRDTASGSQASIVASATNTLLQAMDGMRSFDNVIVMGATNYPWNIDTAVLRRFGQKVYVPLPDEDHIVDMLIQNINQRLHHGLFSSDLNHIHQKKRGI